MPCYHPLKAMRSSGGVQVLPATATLFNLQLPCGQCVGCRLERSRQWAMRCIHEASLHKDNVFITLTYDDANCPDGLEHRHFQLFMKRLRKIRPNVRYYMCGEYGENFGRPHFHAILFNCAFPDATLWKRTTSNSLIYRSATLEALWPFGYSSFGGVTFESAAYVSRYVMKKITGKPADAHYTSVNTYTAEVFTRRPEYNRMSLKPGIGATWYDKYASDVFPHDRVIRDGTPSKPPRYYDKLLARTNPALHDKIKAKRVLDNLDTYKDNTPQRLHAKETVTKATLSKLKRGLT